MAMVRGSVARQVVPYLIVAKDGSGDYTDIQTAIDALPSTGGAILIKVGTYQISTALTIKIDNVKLEGVGKGTIIQPTAAISVFDIQTSAGGVVNNAILKNFYIDGNSIGTTGISIKGTESIISNCWIEDINGAGISNQQGTNNKIINNFLKNNSGGGIETSADVDNIRVLSNDIENCANGLLIQETADSIISNNIIKEGDGSGIRLNSCTDCIVSNNVVIDNDVSNTTAYDGIALYSCDRIVVSNNRCQDNGRYEIFISAGNNNLVHGNDCIGTDHKGTIVDTGTKTAMGFNILDTTGNVYMKGRFVWVR